MVANHVHAAENPVGSTTPITIRAGKTVLNGTLNDSPTARDFLKSLPVTMKMTRWGEREYYGKVGKPLAAGKSQNGFANGDIAYWVPGGSFAIFFDNRHNPDISDLIVIGKITSDLKAFDGMAESIDMQIERVK
ncbi:MAG: hypothetical protein H6R07_667 [Proteobacteria bacterium]|nr:hypothetical protein [Pseudomonadota bacterium]